MDHIGEVDPVRAWPWLQATRRIIEAGSRSRLAGTHIMSASDYSGTHNSSRYWVFSCIYIDEFGSQDWPSSRRRWRQAHVSDGRRLSYKSLGDRVRAKALSPFLAIAEQLSGLVVTVAVDKRVDWMATSPTTLAKLAAMGVLAGKWGPAAFETMSRVTLLWSLGLAAVCASDQHVTWITDEDDIAANDGRHTDLLNWAGRLSSFFVRARMRELAVAPVSVDDGTRGFEDIVAIPDLCAGMFAELVNSASDWQDCNGFVRFDASAARPKAARLSDWYFAAPVQLSRVAVLIRRTVDGQGMVSRVTATE